MDLGLIIVVGLLFMLIVTLRGIRIVHNNHRVALFRLRRLYRIAHSGVFFLIPRIDAMIDVDLNEKIPDWRNLSSEELEERIKSLVPYGNQPIE